MIIENKIEKIELYDNELEMEKVFVAKLVEMGYEQVQISNNEDFLQNLRVQMTKHNIEALNSVGIDNFDYEQWLQIMGKLQKSGMTKFDILRDGEINLKTQNGNIGISLFNKVDWCKNVFQVARQVAYKVGNEDYRFDVVIFINGLPLGIVELKSQKIDLKKAFEQVRNYKQNISSWYEFLQILMISNGTSTKYLANSNTLSFDFSFEWSDSSNVVITDLLKFAQSFLKPCHFGKMVARYMIQDTKKVIKILRPYQCFAVEKILDSVENTPETGGYIWHTTGSGKTLTSFVASTILSKKVNQVLFVVDRKDLDAQTIDEFNNFGGSSVENVNANYNTKALISQLNDTGNKLIVTTIQKLFTAIEKQNSQIIGISNKKTVIIFDECHRSQGGNFHSQIRNFFKNSQLFGFTGTPIFEVENDNNDSDDLSQWENRLGNHANPQNDYPLEWVTSNQASPFQGSVPKDEGFAKNKPKLANNGVKTTADIFGKCLHQYLIINAIKDQNVLPFSVEYMESQDDDKEYLKSKNRQIAVANKILEIHKIKTKSVGGQVGYTAMFCTDSIDSLKHYYTLLSQNTQSLKIATIFSAGGSLEEESFETETLEPSNKAFLQNCISNYNQMCGTNYNSGSSFYEYYKDIAKRVKNKDIDILIVVNMFLTGFDSKSLNTMYVDKNLQYHGLIQAFSRTNRVLDANKSHGNIVVFRDLKQKVDQAIKMFSLGDNSDVQDVVILRPYGEYLEEVNSQMRFLDSNFAPADEIENIEDEDKKIEFLAGFRKILKLLNILKTFSDFKKQDLLLPPETIRGYQKEYLKISEQAKVLPKDSPIANFDFAFELMRTDEINLAYILEMMDKNNTAEFVMSFVESSKDLSPKKELFREFFETDTELENTTKSARFETFKEEKKQIAKKELIKENKIIPENFDHLAYIISAKGNKIKQAEIEQNLTEKPKLIKSQSILKNIKEKLANFWEVFVKGF